METENTALKNAIAAILAEVKPEADRPELQAKIRQAAEIAGLSQDGEAAQGSTMSSDTPSSRVSSDNANTTPSNPPQQARTMAPRLSHAIAQSTNMLTMYRDPFQCTTCTEGAAAVLPFLGPGAFTFAGLIFWHLVEKHEARAHAQEPPLAFPRPQLELEQRALEPVGVWISTDDGGVPLRFTDLITQTSPGHASDTEAWIKMTEARMKYYQIQSQGHSSEHGSHTSPASQTKRRNWLSPITAEQRIRAIVGDQVFSVMATPAIERWEKKNRDRAQALQSLDESRVLVDGLLDKMSETFVCMGNGPHWDARDFDSMFLEWCSPITGHQVQTAKAY